LELLRRKSSSEFILVGDAKETFQSILRGSLKIEEAGGTSEENPYISSIIFDTAEECIAQARRLLNDEMERMLLIKASLAYIADVHAVDSEAAAYADILKRLCPVLR
jgi:hypothetical protein